MPIEKTVQIPPYNELLWPTLRAVRDLGNSAMLDEIDERVVETEGFSEEQLAVLHKDGPRTEIEYRLAWARTYLKKMGALDNPVRANWVTTPLGRSLTEDEIEARWKTYLAQIARARKRNAEAAERAGADPRIDVEVEGEEWREELLEALLEMSPAGFEHLANRLLKTAGFVNTRVTGRSGDGGIDGVGTYRPSLVSFPIFFQCKRYKGTVGPEKVRDFRGAIQGRGERGLLISTGNFSTAAKEEAMREGAIPIDLIDGERLCNLLKELGLGVETTTRSIEEVEVQTEFFRELSARHA